MIKYLPYSKEFRSFFFFFVIFIPAISLFKKKRERRNIFCPWHLFKMSVVCDSTQKKKELFIIFLFLLHLFSAYSSREDKNLSCCSYYLTKQSLFSLFFFLFLTNVHVQSLLRLNDYSLFYFYRVHVKKKHRQRKKKEEKEEEKVH